jgi:PhnB protein
MNKPQLSPYLCFNNNCEEAMNFYQSILGGELKISRFGEFENATRPVEESEKNKVMHAVLENDTLSFMASDGMPDRPVVFGDSVSMSISGADEAKLTGFFNGLSAGGTITMPLEKQVWGDSFGMVTDKYNIHWMVNIGTGGATPSSDQSAPVAA